MDKDNHAARKLLDKERGSAGYKRTTANELSSLTQIYDTVQTGSLSRAANFLNRFGVAPATNEQAYNIGHVFAPKPSCQLPENAWRHLKPTMIPRVATSPHIAQAVRKQNIASRMTCVDGPMNIANCVLTTKR